MIFRLFRSDPMETTIERLYGAIVAQARSPVFYRDLAVPDTIGGRFDMIVLHLVLFFHRLKDEPAGARALGQAVFDLFVADMDRSLRDLGVGDTSVPRKMKTIGDSFYGRLAAYDAALAEAQDTALVAALARNLFPDVDDPPAAPRLAAYVRGAVRHLAARPVADFAAGTLDFPDIPDGP